MSATGLESTEGVPLDTMDESMQTSGDGTWENDVLNQLTDISGSLTSLQECLVQGREADALDRQTDVDALAAIQLSLKENTALLSELKELLTLQQNSREGEVQTDPDLHLYGKTQTYLLCGILLVLAFLLGIQIFKWFSGFLFRMFDRV